MIPFAPSAPRATAALAREPCRSVTVGPAAVVGLDARGRARHRGSRRRPRAACSARNASSRGRWVISTSGPGPPARTRPRSGCRKLERGRSRPRRPASRTAAVVRPQGQAAAAGLVARKTRAVEQQHAKPGAREPVGGHRAGGPLPRRSRRTAPRLERILSGMGDSSVQVEDAGDLRVRQARIGRPRTLSRYASVGEARILFENPKNRLLLVDDDSIYSGHLMREDVPERASPTRRRSCSTSRRDCPQIGPDDSVADGTAAGERRVRQPAAVVVGEDGSRACSPSTSATATSAWTCAGDGRPAHRAHAGRLPAARRVRVAAASGWCTGRPALQLRRSPSAAAGWPTPCGRGGCSAATASPCCRRTRRRCSRRTSACRRRAACWWPSTPASRRGGRRASWSTAARACCSSTPSWRRSSAAGPPRRRRSCAATTPARPATPTRSCSPPPRPDDPSAWLADEEEPISINYTSGTTGGPKGVRLHLPRRLPERARRVIVAGLGARVTYLWTLPMFHCNGWCFPWAVTAVGGTHVTLRAVDAGEVWRLIDERGRDPLQRRADRAPRVANHPRAHRARAARDRAGRPPRRPRRRCSPGWRS